MRFIFFLYGLRGWLRTPYRIITSHHERRDYRGCRWGWLWMLNLFLRNSVWVFPIEYGDGHYCGIIVIWMESNGPGRDEPCRTSELSVELKLHYQANVTASINYVCIYVRSLLIWITRWPTSDEISIFISHNHNGSSHGVSYMRECQLNFIWKWFSVEELYEWICNLYLYVKNNISKIH